MDRLLRRQARQESAAASRAGNDDESTATARAGGAAHLDADEMNAYAEGALPDKTRSRYVAHLADCDDCRSLVTKLTLATNVATASSAGATTVAASTSRSWREWLAALFAPQVLRYAVPALAVLIIAVAVFIASRGARKDELVATNEQPELSSSQASRSQQDQQANTATATTNTSGAPVGGNAANANFRPGDSEPRRADATEAASPSLKKESETGGLIAQNEPKPAEQQPQMRDNTSAAGKPESDEDKNVALARPAPPADVIPATKSPTADVEISREEEARKSTAMTDKAKGGLPASSARDNNYVLDGVENKTQAGAQRTQESGRRARPAARGKPSATETGGQALGTDAKDDRATETRSVGGRTFRRQGGAWVDTAYNSSRTTVNVTRGSEQYRALIADEPGLRNIANQLGGTIIVVWKNRAYRIY